MTEPIQPQQEILIVTGLSGAGRSTVGKALEDMGWYVVDNMPLTLLPTLTDMVQKSDRDMPRIAAVIDVRGVDFSAGVRETLESLKGKANVRMLFMETTVDTIIRRFESVRRPHPLQHEGSLMDGIAAEQEIMRDVRAAADIVIDSTRFNVHQLTMHIRELFSETDNPQMRVMIRSFGFKYGVPTDVDFMIDMRFLPNPFWNPALKDMTGLDEAVSNAVLGAPEAIEFLENYVAALQVAFKGFEKENKHDVSIAVGCTGGKHRSVATVQYLAKSLGNLPGLQVFASHIDLGRE